MLKLGLLARPTKQTVRFSTTLKRYASLSSPVSPSESPASATTGEGDTLASKLDPALRLQAIRLYKELHRLGRDYPDPAYDFNKRLRRAYEKNAKLTNPDELRRQLALAEHVKKEILAMLSLKKFRHLRRAYHPNEGPR